MSRGEGARIYHLPRLVSPASRKPLSKISVIKDALPMHEAVAIVGEEIPASRKELARLGMMVHGFRKTSSRHFDEAMETHAWRHMDFFYRCEDPEGMEQKRMISVLSAAIYLRETVDVLWERTRAAGDVRACALFEVALESTATFLSPPHYQKSALALHASFNRLGFSLSPSMRKCDMELLPLPEIVRSRVEALIALCHAAMDRLEANAR